MKRSLLVAALSTLAAGSAMAQSSVTVWGRVNLSIENQDTNASNKTIMANNGSRLGFRGTEDLGGGLRANFALETRYNADTGAQTFPAFWGGAGETSVSLSSTTLGTGKMGHYTSEAYFATSDVTDLLNHGTGSSSDQLYKYLGDDNNKVSYRTPEFFNAWAELAVLLGEGNAATPNAAYDFAANWALGAFGVGIGYQKGPNEDSQYAIRGSWGVSPFILTGYYQRFNSEAGNAGKNIYRLAGQYDIGAVELHLAGGYADQLDGTGILTDESKKRQYTVGTNYNFSKRTKVYAYYNRDESDAMNGIPDEHIGSFAVGIRHNF